MQKTETMKIYLNLLLISCLIFPILGPTVCCQALKDEADGKSFNSTTKLWYEEPASMWSDALPIGNGRLGGMVFGRTHEELIQLNENTVWAGGPYNSNGKGGYSSLDSIRKLVFEGKGKEAEKLFEKK
jgi:alpha-L-fucosidase 2